MILGTIFRVMNEDEEAAERIRNLLAAFDGTARPARAARIIQIVRSDDGKLVAHNDCRRFTSVEDDWDDFLTSIVAVINSAAIGSCEQFAVHSAVVSRNGFVVALPASTGGGKTTMAASLLREGFSYLSDEALVLTSGGLVIPYPKPMALSPWSADVLDLPHAGNERLAMPGDLGGGFGTGGEPITDIIQLERGGSDTRIESAPRSEGVVALLTNSFNHYKDPGEAFRLATEIARNARVWRLSYDDPRSAAALVASELTELNSG